MTHVEYCDLERNGFELIMVGQIPTSQAFPKAVGSGGGGGLHWHRQNHD